MEFEEQRLQLEQRVTIVAEGLAACGIRVAELNTEELVTLFYGLFNPGISDKPIINIQE
jgi:hypothetical protein